MSDLGFYERLAARARERAFVRQVEAWLHPEPDEFPPDSPGAGWGAADFSRTWTASGGNTRDYTITSGFGGPVSTDEAP